MRVLITALTIILFASAAPAAVLHVPANYATIQAALNAATSGDEVLVAAGTYHENLVFSGPQDGVRLHSESGPAATIIDGGKLGSVISISSVGSSTEIAGFTITNGGHDPVQSADVGGGIRIASASPIITNNIIRNNSAFVGGGIYQGFGSAHLVGNEIRDNLATFGGGGIYCESLAVPDIQNNIISGNDAGPNGGGGVLTNAYAVVSSNEFIANHTVGTGGGLRWNGSGGAADYNRIVGNSADVAGGGIYITNGSFPGIRYSWLQDNSSKGSGGGIYVDNLSGGWISDNVIVRNNCAQYGGGVTIWRSTPTLRNNTIVLNFGTLGGGGIYITDNSHPSLSHNIVSHSVGNGFEVGDLQSTLIIACNDVWGNTASNYSGLPDPTGTNGHFSEDPLYCNIDDLDFHLNEASPCTAANAPAGCFQLLTGALGVACEGPVPTQVSTWGRIKATYR